MKDLLQKLTDLENTLDSMDPTPKEVKQINEAASMSINMSGDTADDVARLAQIMRDGGAPDAGEMKPDMMPPMGPPDMGKMRDLVKLAPPMDMDGMDGPPDMPSMGKPDMDKDDDKDKLMGMGMEDDVEEAGYDNSPEEDYKDHHYMTKDLSGGLNREKKAYAKAQDGDNAMAVEELQAALRDALINKMAEGKEEFKKSGKDGDGSFDESGCVGEMKKLKASGCAKHEMYDKVAEKYGCGKSQFEKLFAAHCG
tara:strand:+ start:7076 stop:7834 length:759 start_codon:yes stop_codon:yes gene_type:complete